MIELRVLQVGEFADIGFDTNRSIPELADLLLQHLGCLRMAHIVDDDIGVLPGELENDRLAYPAIATGDDRDLVL